jgi:hypothetical protein
MRAAVLASVALIHIAVFAAIGLTAVFALESVLDTGGVGSTIAVWAKYGTLAWQSFSDYRRFPFALCVFAYGVLLPGLCSLWCTLPMLKGRPIDAGTAALRATACSVAANIAFLAALAGVLATIPFRIGIMASYGVAWYAMMVLVWGIFHIPSAAISHRLVTRAVGPPALQPA